MKAVSVTLYYNTKDNPNGGTILIQGKCRNEWSQTEYETICNIVATCELIDEESDINTNLLALPSPSTTDNPALSKIDQTKVNTPTNMLDSQWKPTHTSATTASAPEVDPPSPTAKSEPATSPKTPMRHKGQQTDSPTCISCGNDAQEMCCQSCVIDKIENAKVQNKNHVKSLIQPLVAELESLKEENKLLKLDLKALTSKNNAIEGRQKRNSPQNSYQARSFSPLSYRDYYSDWYPDGLGFKHTREHWLNR